MLFEIISLDYCNGGKARLFQKYKISFLFFNHCFSLIYLIISLVLLNYPSE